jgi:ribosomal protein L37AE/L43A
MSRYSDYKNHRKLYIEYHGSIPIDSEGRSYDIHHKNSDHDDNSKENLIAVNIQDHYNIHYGQEDYGACWYIAKRLSMTPQEIKELASLQNKKRVVNGTHNFLDGAAAKKSAVERLSNGTHQFCDKEFHIQRSRKLVASGKHQFQDPEFNRRMMLEGKSPLTMMETCPHCHKTMNRVSYSRWHGDKCKMKGST